jgi:hypothetical protein
MIRLEITADTPEQFRAHMAALAGLLPSPPNPYLQSMAEANARQKGAGAAPALHPEPVAEEAKFVQPFSVQADDQPRRGPGRPRKVKPESVTIEGTATEVKDPPATADPSPAIIVPDEPANDPEPAAEATPATPAPFLALDPLKDAYTLDEVRTLAMAYVRAMVVDAKGNTDRDAARGVLKGLLGAFGVEGVGGLDEPQRLAMVKLIHHLAPFGRTPPAAETFAGIVASFGG